MPQSSVRSLSSFLGTGISSSGRTSPYSRVISVRIGTSHARTQAASQAASQFAQGFKSGRRDAAPLSLSNQMLRRSPAGSSFEQACEHGAS